MMSSLDRRRLDAWITREPPWDEDERPPLKCAHCGCFLVREPLGERVWVQLARCSGNAKVLTCTYDAEQDAAILRIIGDEFAGTTYEVAYPPECGGSEPQRLVHWDGDIDPKKAESYRHEPHWYQPDPMSEFATYVRCCGHCGHFNEEPIW